MTAPTTLREMVRRGGGSFARCLLLMWESRTWPDLYWLLEAWVRADPENQERLARVFEGLGTVARASSSWEQVPRQRLAEEFPGLGHLDEPLAGRFPRLWDPWEEVSGSGDSA